MADGERMTDIRPLPIWQETGLSAEDAERIKSAKRELQLPFLVQLAPAASEGGARVVALGTPPPFVCDYFLLESTFDPNLKDAILWVLDEAPDDFRVVTMAEMLSDWLDGDVEEVTDAEDVRRVVQRTGGTDLPSVDGLPEHDDGCSKFGSTENCGTRGCVDPNLCSERDYRRAIREAAESERDPE